MKKILVIHGPNLDLLGKREPAIYGKVTLKEINSALTKLARKRKAALKIFQSNHEGEIVDLIGKSKGKIQGLLINPAAYTHTSVAIRDAIAACGIIAIEVHLSNIYSREEFRQKSLISPVAKGVIMGFGMKSYLLGLEALLDLIDAK
ncbi:MAG: type II 3-dehydroquinate dehydratase [Candidatus Omnitrophica bacterium]|nr:type II 3-dehydroquinate dehydratase [Candidatus Omnitrophota bacterium]MBI5145084.1 type II 3-dehydroquinate dehydratase [Candidatus Omnitrophota bacterium]